MHDYGVSLRLDDLESGKRVFELRARKDADGKLVSIPREYYEAAEVDGASAWLRFRHVTLPLLRPVIAVVTLFSTIFTFSDFNIVQVLTRGGPVNTTHLFATLAYQVGLFGGNLGQGAAISLFLFPMLAAVVFIQLRYIRRE